MKINHNTNLDKYLDVAKCDFKTRYLKKKITSKYNKS